MGRHEVSALIDSGASRNVISSGLVEKLGMRCNVRETGLVCTGFDGKVSKLDGELTLDLNIGMLSYRGSFIVVPSLAKHPLILGAPFLHGNGIAQKLENNLRVICGRHAIHQEN